MYQYYRADNDIPLSCAPIGNCSCVSSLKNTCTKWYD